MVPLLAVLLVVQSGCTQTKEATAPTTTTAEVDVDAIAGELSASAQEELDVRLEAGAVELGPGQSEDVPAYGETPIVGIIRSDHEGAETMLLVLLALGERLDSFESDLTNAEVTHIGVEDPTGGRAFVTVGDLLSFGDGEIGPRKLRDRLTFDY